MKKIEAKSYQSEKNRKNYKTNLNRKTHQNKFDDSYDH